MTKIILYTIVFTIFLFSCENETRKNKAKQPNQQEALIRANKYLLKQDADAVKGYIRRHEWNMTQTKTGLWYEIVEKGNGAKAESGKIATLAYKLWLLDGRLVYSSDSTGNKSFTLGKGGVEPGLEQGILLMNEGDKARFIMLPHLAYGLIGDEKRIPARSTIVYEVHLLKISDQK